MGNEKSNNENVFTEFLMLDAECIVCAAGFSSRMGRWKVDLSTFDDKSFLEHSLSSASVCERVVLVGGYRYKELCKRVPAGFSGRILENIDYEKGMLGTVQKALADGEGYFFIMPVDMPLLSGYHLRTVYDNRAADKVVRPSFNGIPGHPVLCPPLWREKLLKGKGKSPSSVISRQDQILIPWDDDSVVFDVDTQGAYDEYRGRQL